VPGVLVVPRQGTLTVVENEPICRQRGLLITISYSTRGTGPREEEKPWSLPQAGRDIARIANTRCFTPAD
jgi:hypothetical protein